MDMPELVVGDATRFRQILSNLLSNSVKFTEEGHIFVSAWVVDPRRYRMVCLPPLPPTPHPQPHPQLAITPKSQ